MRRETAGHGYDGGESERPLGGASTPLAQGVGSHFRLRSSDRLTHDSDAPTSVYLYYDQFDVLIYVGVTSRGAVRNAEHNSTKDWWAHVTRQEVEHHPDRASALAREHELIERHLPPFNRQHNPHAAQMREAYVLFCSAHAQGSPDPLRLYQALDRGRLNLEPHNLGDPDRLTLRTSLEDSLLAPLLVLPPEGVRVLGIKHKRPGRVMRLERQGPFTLLVLTKPNQWLVKDAFARLRYDTKARQVVLRSVSVVATATDRTAA